MAFDPNTTKPEIDFPGDAGPRRAGHRGPQGGRRPEAGAGDTI